MEEMYLMEESVCFRSRFLSESFLALAFVIVNYRLRELIQNSRLQQRP